MPPSRIHLAFHQRGHPLRRSGRSSFYHVGPVSAERSQAGFTLPDVKQEAQLGEQFARVFF